MKIDPNWIVAGATVVIPLFTGIIYIITAVTQLSSQVTQYEKEFTKINSSLVSLQDASDDTFRESTKRTSDFAIRLASVERQLQSFTDRFGYSSIQEQHRLTSISSSDQLEIPYRKAGS